MSWLEIVGVVALYLVGWLGGAWLAAIITLIIVSNSEWGRRAELAVFGPSFLVGGAWLVIGAIVALFMLGRLTA